MTKVKVCGITRVADALKAVKYGANFLGFIFADSPRRVNVEQAARIIAEIPDKVGKVGVFLNHPYDSVREIIKETGINYLQFHGNESPEYCREFRLPVIKAFRVRDEKSLVALGRYQTAVYLLDSFHPDRAGGTGKTFDWQLAVKAGEYGKIIIAGGLNEENVQEAIHLTQPFAVDVSSGIEKSPGIKDELRMKRFIDKVKDRQRGRIGDEINE